MSEPLPRLGNEILCENTPIWRPKTHELILQKRIAQHVRIDPENSSKTLPALGPLLYTCIYNPLTHTEQLLENGHQLFFSLKCGDKGIYFAALNSCKAEFKEIDSRLVFIPSSSNLVSVWNLVTKKMLPQFKTAQTSFKISPQETYIACDSEDNKDFIIRALANNMIVRSITKKTLPILKNPNYCPSLAESCSFSSDDRLVAYADEGEIQVIDLHAPEQEAIRVPGLTPHFMALNILLVPNAAMLHLYDTNKPLIDLGSQCKTLATCCKHTNSGLRNKFQFDTERHDKIIGPSNESEDHFYMINLLNGTTSEWKQVIAISPDLSCIATRDAQNIYIENIDSYMYRKRFQCTHYINAPHVFFSLNNEYLFFENNSLIYIWNFKKGSASHHKNILDGFPLPGSNSTNFIRSSCSPDSRYLLVRTRPSRAILIDLNRLDYIQPS